MKSNPHRADRIPLFFRTAVTFFSCVLGVLLLARLVMLFFVLFDGSVTQWDALFGTGLKHTLKELYIGAKFDARLAVFLSLPLVLGLFFPVAKRHSLGVRTALDSVYGFLFFGVSLIYLVDFGFFFYHRQRVDVTVFDFLRDASISFNMVVQSYPVFWIALGLAFFVTAALFFLDRLLRKYFRIAAETKCQTWKSRTVWSAVLAILLFLGGYGQISSNLFPLRWSNAYFSSNRDHVLLGLNPVQNLYDTARSMKVVRPNKSVVRTAYDDMAAWLRVDNPDRGSLNFWRTIQAEKPKQSRNVVIIIMESLSWPMTSMAPGEDDPTPALRRLAENGLYFSQFYAPTRTTARAVFTTMTGIPDVNREGGTTSRNPALVGQYLPISDFKGYSKFYMIGGSASWANIRGVLNHNVPDLTLLEESDWKAPNVDVWGISDLDLFRESVERLSAAASPFVAVIQTAGFHRPYTIPADNAGFTQKTPSRAVLTNYGFSGAEEYNSLRFSDHALNEFFRLAKKQPWFTHTIFAVMGDHGLYNPSQNMSASYQICRLQGSHIPLVLYAPGLISPSKKDFPCGQPDLFPTLAALAGVPMRHHGLGRNLLDPETERTARQFIAGDSELFRKLVEDGYCYLKESSEGLYRLDDWSGTNVLASEPERAARMRREAEEAYHVSKYLLFHNREKP